MWVRKSLFAIASVSYESLTQFFLVLEKNVLCNIYGADNLKFVN